MNILILTQTVDKDDHLLGFFHNWIKEFAKHFEKVTVICLQKGKYDLPKNVKVFSLGKESLGNKSRFLKKFFYIKNFYKLIWQERKNYDVVFVHMNPEYIVLGGVFWRLLNKKTGLWYTHGSVDLKLRIAEKISNVIFTASSESFRVKSKKLKVLGHGIEVDRFLMFEKNKNYSNFINLNNIKIISIGRISPIKDLITIVKAMLILGEYKINFSLDIVGGVANREQQKYLNKLKKIIKQKNLQSRIRFMGPVSPNEVVEYLKKADLFLSASQTGSLDKAILEPILLNKPVLVCNEAFKSEFGDLSRDFIFEKSNPNDLASKIIALKSKNFYNNLKEIKNKIQADHSLNSLIKKIKKYYE